MTQNEPMPATGAISTIVEQVQAQPVEQSAIPAPSWGGLDLVDVEPVIVQHVIAPAPTWRRANRGEIAMWVGMGAASVVALEIVAAVVIALMGVKW